jgi:hypothetical protein
MGKPEVRRPFGGPVHRWENIKIYIKEIVRWHGLVHKPQGRD